MRRRSMILACALGAAGKAQPPEPAANTREQVEGVERGFAATMARRDHAAFSAFLSEEAVFLSEGRPALRGKRAVAEAWKKFFDAPEAPFSWAPDTVEVLDSGGLALTSGPVHNAKGDLTARFTSIWRREQGDRWRIVFDRGCPVCRS